MATMGASRTTIAPNNRPLVCSAAEPGNSLSALPALGPLSATGGHSGSLPLSEDRTSMGGGGGGSPDALDTSAAGGVPPLRGVQHGSGDRSWEAPSRYCNWCLGPDENRRGAYLRLSNDQLLAGAEAAGSLAPLEPAGAGEFARLVVRVLANSELQPFGNAIVTNGVRSQTRDEVADEVENGHDSTLEPG